MSCINNFGDINETFIIEPLVLDDTFVTGFTLSSNNITLTQNRIDQYSAFTITLSGLTGSSLNVYVTGGTYNNTTGTATFVNSTGGTFQVTGFTTGSTSTASGNYLPLSGGTVTGNTIFQSGLTASTISATTISGDTFYGDGSKLTGIIASAQFTGGTVNGATVFTSGLTANTISATTYQNLPNTLYTGNGVLSGNRIVDLSGKTLNFSSVTNPDTLVMSGGNVGIGTTTPTAKLEVDYGIGAGPGVSIIGGASTFENVALRLWDKGSAPLNRNVLEFGHSNVNVAYTPGARVLSTNPSGLTTTGAKLILETTSSSASTWNTNLLVLSNDSKIGIGTDTPTYKLDVFGNGRFTNELYVDTNLYINNYFQIDTTSTSIPSGYVGIWRRKINGASTYFMEDEQGGAKDKWAFISRFSYGQTREWNQTNSSIVDINYGWQTPNDINFEAATLLIDPVINITGQTGTKVRGIYYNPTLSALTGTTHIAFENKTGDIIFGNLSGSTTRMVVADSTGKLSTQVISNAVTFTGGTVSGPTVFQSGLTANTISATTYENLPKDVFVTGGTYSAAASTLIFTNNTGGTFNVSGITSSTTFTGGTVSGATNFLSGLTANTISATTYQNLPVTADTFVTGFTLSSNTITLTQNRADQYSAFTISLSAYTGSSSASGAYLPLSGGTVTGNTVFTGGLTANTLNVTGNTNLSNITANTLTVTGSTRLAAITANTLNVTGSTRLAAVTADTLTVTGNTRLAGLTANTLTITGNTLLAGLTANTLTITGNTLLAGLTASTISATTYQNLPVTADTFVTGFTLSSNTITLTQNRTGQYSAFTISLSAYTGSSTSVSGAFLPLSGGTVSGATSFISGLTANTVSATTYQNLPNTLYTGNGVLNSNRIVDLSGRTLNFSSSTSANNLVLSGGSVGIGTATPSASALFEISSTTKGFLGPRMTEAQRLAITATAGLIVYQTDADEGYFLYKSFGWVQIM